MSSEDKSEKRRGSALAIFDRRHSANTFGLRRSSSSVGIGIFGSRRNSTPVQTAAVANGSNGGSAASPAGSPATTSLPVTPVVLPVLPPVNTTSVGRSFSMKSANALHNQRQRQIRAEKWQLLARKVLGNLDEEELDGTASCGRVVIQTRFKLVSGMHYD